MQAADPHETSELLLTSEARRRSAGYSPSQEASPNKLTEGISLAVLFGVFAWFTWRGITMFFSGDDMMNMYRAWDTSAMRLFGATLAIWEPVYRPVGDSLYRLFYEAFGFRPLPLYTFCWILLAGNVFAAYGLFRRILPSVAGALTALALVLIHGTFTDLYYSAGTIYDRLCFLFTVATLILYFRLRRQRRRTLVPAIWLLAVLAMGSKESGVAVLPILFCCECIFFLPRMARAGELRKWLRETAPTFIGLIILSLLFVFSRVERTPEIITTANYTPHLRFTIWADAVARYLSLLTFQHLSISAFASMVFLLLSLVLGLTARSRAMLFGLAFFVISITPVALIAGRAGYVLYLPELGLGIMIAAAIGLITAPLTRLSSHAAMIVFALTAFAVSWFQAHNWPPPWNIRLSPEFRFTQQFRHDYPRLPANTKLLFVNDDFPPMSYDLLFNARLLYRDKSIQVFRMHASEDQKPGRDVFDHILTAANGRYLELDPVHPKESVRLNILRDYPVNLEMDIARPDHSAYVVSGLKDFESDLSWRWTDPHAEFKFRLDRAPALFNATIWVPEVVAQPGGRTLSILVGGKQIGNVPLNKAGTNDVAFSVPQDLISGTGYTLVDFDVSNPYRDTDGVAYGVVLVRAGFRYAAVPEEANK